MDVTKTNPGWSSMQRGSRWMYVHHGRGGHVFIVSWHDRDSTPSGTPFRKIDDENLPRTLALLISYGVPLYAQIEKSQANSVVATTTDLLPAIERATTEAGQTVLAMMLNDSASTDDIEKARGRLAVASVLFARTGWTVPIDDDGEPIDTRPWPASTAPLESPDPSASSAPLPSELWIPNAGHYSALQQAVARPDLFNGDESGFPRTEFKRGDAHGHIEMRPIDHDEQHLLPPEAYNDFVAQMWAQRGELSDQDADTLDAVSATWIAEATSPKDEIRVAVDDLLRLRGIQPKKGGTGRRGGFEHEQRIAQLRCLLHLHNMWVTARASVTDNKEGKRTVKLFQSPAFVMTGRTGQLRLDGKSIDVEDVYVTPGRAFRSFFFGPGRQVALLSSLALRYNGRHKAVEKKLIRYFSWRWRCAASDGSLVQKSRVETLLNEANIKIKIREPARTRSRFEQALDQLQEDGAIAAWEYKQWTDEKLPRRGWLPQWLGAVVLIEPPDSVRDAYSELANTKYLALPKPKDGAQQALGREVRERRKRLGVSQMMLAEELGISPASLSRAENGRPTRGIATLLKKWLEQDAA